jgi:hypothetical protein
MARETWTADTIVKKSNPPPMKNDDHPQVVASSKKKKDNGTDMTYSMTYRKETPGTFVYASDDPEAFVNQLYVKKAGMPGGAKKTITITVKEG